MPAPRRARLILPPLLIAALLAPTASLHAQASPSSAAMVDDVSGTWWSVAVDAAAARLTCDLCDRSRDLGGALGLAFGAHASPTVRFGIEGGAWTHREGDVRETVYTAGILAELHPRPASGLHLLGGVGWSGYRAGDFAHDAPRIRLGVGWDFPLSTTWVVGNRILLDAASFAPLDSDGTTVTESVGLSVVRFGLYVRHR